MADQISLRRETNLYDDETIKAVNDKVTSQYAVSTTASATVAKTATVDGDFTLYKNARVSVFFQNANTSTSPTLNVAGTGAKPIWAYGGPLSADGNTFNWVANSTIEFVYDGEHWLVADSGAVGLISKYDQKLTQEAVFNKLTNNGEIRGIFMKDGQMYINMDYLQTGKLKLGGENNGNGLQVVYDENGNEIGRWDKDGLSATGTLVISKKLATNDYLKSQLATVEYWEYDGISGNLRKRTGSGFVTARYVSDSIKSQYAIINEKYTSSGITYYSMSERITSNSSYTKGIYIGDDEGNGLNYNFTYGLNSFSLLCMHGGTISDYRERHLIFNACQIEIGASSNYPNGRILINGAGRASSRANASIEITNTAVYIQATSSNVFSYANGYWRITGSNQSGNIATQSSSSKRYKHEITNKIDAKLNADNLYKLQMKQFKYNDDFEHLQYMDMKGQTIPGFIAEDVAEIYPSAVIHDADGNIESWDERRIIPGMLALIQEQKKQLDEQAERIKKLESNTSFIHTM